ncbi:hypothetical protein [Paenibacillus sp. FSL F4-0243]|uniref:hypothetical protein n=1 Tax=Paenibacillus sp. FSL F4-0243 TaxID=2954732 RepID=UPI0030DC285A
MDRFLDFKKNMNDQRKYHAMFFSIDKFVLEEQVKAFYPKNFFSDVNPTEFFIFTDSNIWCFIENMDATEIILYKNFEVEKLKLVRANNQRQIEAKLEIHLKSGEQILLSPNDEANVDWKDTFITYIEKIFDLLV